MKVPRKSVRTLRGISGGAHEASQPHRLYMQITCLEMEKARRMTERRLATQRLAYLDARLAQIALEQSQLLERIERPARRRTPAAAGTVRTPSDGFHIRY
ncbi:MAG: hypothetical protein LAP21_00255 [Acidobacteriia bacterium]|nr:hypothetical protein [Terriglobia bacterium]